MGKSIQKEELLTMLTDLSCELEKIESMIQRNVIHFKKDLNDQQIELLSSCRQKMRVLESELVGSHNEIITESREMKLEFGHL
ncbi:hypothetical protein [Bacillus sp. 03113]|uniref:hypothetical protein n=1 Tax=Bacillus sp. 03113 TaxID=2578211 RepID=UPI00114264CF|nr:hypothetical protein [Bacillus sp. 03113]